MRARLLLLPVVVVGGLGGCGDDDEPAPPSAACHEAEDGSVEITADDLSWDTDCLEATADEPLTIVIHNDEDGVNHNLHLPDAPGSPATKLIQGPATQDLVLDPGLAPGTYQFLCDIHPNMVGRLEVDEANPPPGG